MPRDKRKAKRLNVREVLVAALAVTVIVVSLWTNWEDFGFAAHSLLDPDARAGSSGAGSRSLLAAFEKDDLTIPETEILSGGPGKDGIPALSDPNVVPVDRADFLQTDDRVVGIAIGNDARAYPIRSLNWHEIINDTVGSTPIAVVYCPLCDSVSVIERRVGGSTLEFGVSGMLTNSNVILYDRTNDALWSQVGLGAISGPNSGWSPRHLPFELTTFDRWRDKYPNSSVATFQTGHARNYGLNPYDSYFKSDRLKFPAKGSDDTRLGRKEAVIGVRVADNTRAYPVSRIAAAPNGRVEDQLGGETIVLEAENEGRVVRIVEMPRDAQVVHTFWFAWNAFHPQTSIFGSN